ncbi:MULTISPECIES: hypothetical protein [unclassified Ensifer]|uniref:hypothetical protein n=1 Tax=unclassified Ensifer TaxID=2633371 RepID=UPI0008133C6E|nr:MULTISPECIES: hypothetical protein [unclassified Ensifer]OCP00663.1 hypothetical protein BC362_03305 [Ensifer sp. LC14]OCP07787.1 hypothetical protein BBX50_20745 [Ensifer sp. LC11]OCP08551.1 hypothetical protein BC374_20960 [Ensifer sp. LC13]OCP32157.1 hypothetical protein BC364_20730 [Ensifer sp. LC499]
MLPELRQSDEHANGRDFQERWRQRTGRFEQRLDRLADRQVALSDRDRMGEAVRDRQVFHFRQRMLRMHQGVDANITTHGLFDVAHGCREEAKADIGGLVEQTLDDLGRRGDLDIEMEREVAPRKSTISEGRKESPRLSTVAKRTVPVFKPLSMSSSDTAASSGDATRRTCRWRISPAAVNLGRRPSLKQLHAQGTVELSNLPRYGRRRDVEPAGAFANGEQFRHRLKIDHRRLMEHARQEGWRNARSRDCDDRVAVDFSVVIRCSV